MATKGWTPVERVRREIEELQEVYQVSLGLADAHKIFENEHTIIHKQNSCVFPGWWHITVHVGNDHEAVALLRDFELIQAGLWDREGYTQIFAPFGHNYGLGAISSEPYRLAKIVCGGWWPSAGAHITNTRLRWYTEVRKYKLEIDMHIDHSKIWRVLMGKITDRRAINEFDREYAYLQRQNQRTVRGLFAEVDDLEAHINSRHSQDLG